MPSIASTPVIAQSRRSTSASPARCRHAKGNTSNAPSVQRQNASPTGGTGRTAGARAGFALDAAAEQVRIEVLDAAGNAVSTTTRRNVAAGTHTFDWDGRDANGRAQPDGRFTLRVTAGSADDLKPATALTAASVTAVVSSSEGARIELGGGGQRAVSDVRAIL